MDAQKITDFFKYHIEKIILVVVVAVSGFLLYQGFQIPHYTDKQQPDRLAAEATEVRNAIDEDHNDAIIPERVPDFDIVKATERRDQPVNASLYRLDYPWQGKGEQSIVRRSDPMLVPPQQLLVSGVTRVIAIRSAKEEYELTKLEPADEVEKVEKPKPRTRGRRGRNMMMEDMMGGMEEMMDMEGMMDDMGDMGDMESMGSMAGSGRRLAPEYNFGLKNPVPTRDKRYPSPRVSMFIAGTAVIPHRQIYENYEQALGDAEGYNPRRDTPFYYDFEVQRADVTDKSVDQLAQGDWINVWNRLMYTQVAAALWSGFAPEIVPADYRNDLTMWIPPVLLDDYRSFSLHPAVPLKTQDQLKREELGTEEVIEEVDESTIFDRGQLRGPGAARGQFGGGEDMDMMDDMMEMEDDMMGMGMGMMGAFGARGLEVDPVEYQLLRFYDFYAIGKNQPKPGRKYVYRLRFAVNDPNFPANPEMQPKVNSLAPDATVRVLEKMEQASQTKKRDFKRWTDWSEPSDPVSLADLQEYYAGPVDPGTTYDWTIGGRKVSYPRDSPKAKILASQYNTEYNTRVPMELDVTEGSVLSHKQEFADVVDPITLEIKKLPDPEIISQTTIIDLDGGTKLSITTDDLKAPGMMLLYDNEGKLKVTDDVVDQEYYRIYTFADEKGL